MKIYFVVVGLFLASISAVTARAQVQDTSDPRGIYFGWQAGKIGDPVGVELTTDVRFSRYMSVGARVGRFWKNDVRTDDSADGLTGMSAVAETAKAGNLTFYTPSFHDDIIQPFVSADFGIVGSRTRYDYQGSFFQPAFMAAPVTFTGVDKQRNHNFYMPLTAGVQFHIPKSNWVILVGGGWLMKGYLQNDPKDRFQIVAGVERHYHGFFGIDSLFRK